MSGGRAGAEPSGPFPQGAAQIGDVIAGRFRIDGELGSGGMARVFRVVDIATQRTFALKLLRPEIANDEEAIARLRREGELLDRLDNPAIVGIETYGKLADGRLFLVMELLEGQTLGELMRETQRLDPEQLTPIVTGVAAGLHAAHEAGVVHRDLKPDNIFLARATTDRGTETQVKILDFGISKAVGFERLTRTGQVLGTPRYMAPEQLAADHDLDARVDVYAMGVILYEALAGQPPFVAVSPSDLIVAILHGKVTPLRVYRSELDDDTLAVVSRAMARARDARYGSAHELAEAWVDAAQPLPSAGPSKRGMRTKALGGADPIGLGDAESSADLRPGTFSALEEPAPVSTPSVKQAGMSGERTVGARPGAIADASGPSSPVSTTGPSPASTSGPSPMSGTLPQLPLANRRTWLLVAALFAGALTALVVILILHYLGDSAESEAPPDDPHVTESAPEPVVANDDAIEETGASADDDEDELPVAPEPPVAEGEPERESSSTRRRRRRARAADTTQPEASEAETAMAQTPLQMARAALRSGDAEGCLQQLEGWGSSAAVLRLRADCQLRAGQRSEAVKNYERFCQRYPDDPALAEVRAIVSRYGGRCP